LLSPPAHFPFPFAPLLLRRIGSDRIGDPSPADRTAYKVLLRDRIGLAIDLSRRPAALLCLPMEMEMEMDTEMEVEVEMETDPNPNPNTSPSAADDATATASGEAKACADCHTTKTPLWRGGPQGPKVWFFIHHQL
jgi:hypothetical protein